MVFYHIVFACCALVTASIPLPAQTPAAAPADCAVATGQSRANDAEAIVRLEQALFKAEITGDVRMVECLTDPNWQRIDKQRQRESRSALLARLTKNQAAPRVAEMAQDPIVLVNGDAAVAYLFLRFRNPTGEWREAQFVDFLSFTQQRWRVYGVAPL